MVRVKRERGSDGETKSRKYKRVEKEVSFDSLTDSEKNEILAAISSGAKLVRKMKKECKEFSDSTDSELADSEITSDSDSSEISTDESSTETSNEYSDSESDNSGPCVDKRELEKALGIKIRSHKSKCHHYSESSSEEDKCEVKREIKRRR